MVSYRPVISDQNPRGYFVGFFFFLNLKLLSASVYSYIKCDATHLCHLLENNLVIITGNVLFTECVVCLEFLVVNYSFK